MGQVTFNARACHFFLVYLQRGWKCYELQPGWNSISKRSMVGAGEFVSVTQLAGLDTKALPWPQEWLKLQTLFRSPWHVPKPWQGRATQGCWSGHSWASSRLAPVSNSCCSQQVLLFNSNGKSLPWFYDKAVIQALQSCSYFFLLTLFLLPLSYRTTWQRKRAGFTMQEPNSAQTDICGRWTSHRIWQNH